jgi:hypothetical protein
LPKLEENMYSSVKKYIKCILIVFNTLIYIFCVSAKENYTTYYKINNKDNKASWNKIKDNFIHLGFSHRDFKFIIPVNVIKEDSFFFYNK